MSPNTGLNTRSRAIKTARIGAPRPEYPVDRDRRAVSVPVQILVRLLVGEWHDVPEKRVWFTPGRFASFS